MGQCQSTEIVEQPEKIQTPYERLSKLERYLLDDIKPTDSDYPVAQKILKERQLAQYGNMMRGAPNMGF